MEQRNQRNPRDKTVNGARIFNNKTNEEIKIDVTVFVAIGHKPNTDIFKPWIDGRNRLYKTIPGRSLTNVEGWAFLPAVMHRQQ
jgi:thioredoxin reductase (NADPH)